MPISKLNMMYICHCPEHLTQYEINAANLLLKSYLLSLVTYVDRFEY